MQEKIERFEASFYGQGFEPHRHDTYAIGRTISGVHCFNYRGEKRTSLSGDVIILHPDELHDGESGNDDAFHYRIMYIEPSLIQSILGGKPLPHIKGGISNDPRLLSSTSFLFDNLNRKLDPLEEDDLLYDLANSLDDVAGSRKKRVPHDYRAAEKAREYIHSAIDTNITLDQLVNVSGKDKWRLSRDFRALYGTSPYRYLTMRRLDKAKLLLKAGYSIIEASLYSGFVDQSHMTNHFTKTFGLSPARWIKLINNY